MKLKWLFLLAGIMAVGSLLAQPPGHAKKQFKHKHHNKYYSYSYAPYRYTPYRTSVSVIAHLPFGSVGVTFGDRHYHYHGGYYYQPVPRGYVIVRPPVGIIVPVLPPSSVYIIIGGSPYYRSGDIYYMPLGGNRYKVVPEPRVEEEYYENDSDVIDGFEKITIEGKTYYKKGGIYYKAKVDKNCDIYYEEVGETIK